MKASTSHNPPPAFALTRRRRSFGLDAPRPPDLRRIEAAILSWLTTAMPQVFWLRGTDDRLSHQAPRTSTTLVLLLPGACGAVLRIEVAPDRLGAETLALAARCASRRIPFSIVSTVDEVRAALRRLGVEPGEA